MLIANRNGLVVAACATQSRTAEREAALAMLDQMGLRPEKIPRADPRITLGADKLYPERGSLSKGYGNAGSSRLWPRTSPRHTDRIF